jgi:hypothetical protein
MLKNQILYSVRSSNGCKTYDILRKASFASYKKDEIIEALCELVDEGKLIQVPYVLGSHGCSFWLPANAIVGEAICN